MSTWKSSIGVRTAGERQIFAANRQCIRLQIKAELNRSYELCDTSARPVARSCFLKREMMETWWWVCGNYPKLLRLSLSDRSYNDAQQDPRVSSLLRRGPSQRSPRALLFSSTHPPRVFFQACSKGYRRPPRRREVIYDFFTTPGTTLVLASFVKART